MKRLLPLLLLGALMALLAAGLRQQPQVLPSALAGKPLPPLDAPLLHDGGQRFDASAMKGQVWLLNVWATWCTGCREEHDTLLAMAKQGLLLHGVNYKDDPQRAATYLRTSGNPFRSSLVDADGRLGIDLGVYGVPETFVIDREGRVRMRHAGPLTPELVRDKLQPLLQELRQ
ncbi:DsbE family thiol:disulfide interchange protein [Ramlibacter sp. USB13]|uniref:DsbE family thiol:disulfide interchange protein n=1 Tax=Ramlibacter cellulosilyticus TaxID=2764187 RepID=A0A923SFM5_9BURK|nr:DsbE family thiol:disulfide interchange protein [Ramlibacter cellulosilyticus]MBC5784107.1 DsbE family thiol:disulfide interchange protein [Ramlibacter cellulosilyticus]